MNVPYLVAKYVPDILRMEPVNIGVIALCDGRLHARFIGESDEPGLDLRKVRGIVHHTGAYKQWIDYWLHLIRAGTSADETIRALLSSSNGNYLLREGATMAVPQTAEFDIQQALEYLFHLLVTEFPRPSEEEISLGQRCEEIIRNLHLDVNPSFRRAPSVPCPLSPEVTEYVQPNYAYLNGAAVYFQRVPFNPRRPEATQKELHNAAWIFDKLKKTNQNCMTRALVKGSQNGEAEPFLRVLSVVANDIVDVSDEQAVRRGFAELVA